MASSKPINDTRDGALDYAEAPSYLFSGMGFGHADDLSDVIVAEFSVEQRHDASLDGMGVISKSGNPFKIIDAVIGLDCIDMIDLGQIVWVQNERQSNKAMHWDVSGFDSDNRVRGIAEINVDVTSGSDHQLKFASFIRADTVSTSPTTTYSVQTSHLAEVTDLIKVGETVDSNGSPFFNHWADFHAEMLAITNTAYIAGQLKGEAPCPWL